MGCFHLCGFAMEKSGEERDSSNDGKRGERKKLPTLTADQKELNKGKSLEKGNKSWCLDRKEEEPSSSSSKGNKFKDAKRANAKKDINSQADGSSFLAKARGTGLFGPGTSNSAPKLASKDGKIAILCFEIANTVFRGAKLIESLSDENVKHCKEVVLQSEGIRRLVSGNMQELLNLAASDKRKELEVLSREVVRFGNRCRDSAYHNLGRRFARFEAEKPPDRLKEIARGAMEHLIGLAERTSNLYLELYVLKKFEQDYKKKCSEEQKYNLSQKGDRAKDVKQQIENQKSYIKQLRKETLWSKKLEEVVVKLVDIVQFIHFEINRAFDIDQVTGSNVEKPTDISETLSSEGLALHYAHIISKIDNVVILQSSVPQTLREALYMSLPDNIKASLRPMLLSLQPSEFTIKQIRSELDNILRWLLPMANNTIKAQYRFGQVGEMANIRTEANNKVAVEPNLIRLQTLDHAKKDQADEIILVLLLWLHRLVTKNINGSHANHTRSLVDPQRIRRSYATPATMKNSKNVKEIS